MKQNHKNQSSKGLMEFWRGARWILLAAVQDRRRRQGAPRACRPERRDPPSERPILGHILSSKRLELPMHRRAGLQTRQDADPARGGHDERGAGHEGR